MTNANGNDNAYRQRTALTNLETLKFKTLNPHKNWRLVAVLCPKGAFIYGPEYFKVGFLGWPHILQGYHNVGPPPKKKKKVPK